VYEFSASTRTSGVKISQGTGFMLPKGDKSGRERGRLRRKFEAHQEAGSVIAEDEIEIIKGAPDAIKKIRAIHPIQTTTRWWIVSQAREIRRWL